MFCHRVDLLCLLVSREATRRAMMNSAALADPSFVADHDDCPARGYNMSLGADTPARSRRAPGRGQEYPEAESFREFSYKRGAKT